MNEIRYLSLNLYMKQRFQNKVYKLALQGGTTCPNRDGTCGYGGCIFCGEGSGGFAADTIDEAIAKLEGKHTGSRFIAYFQSYTSTYRMADELKARIRVAAEDPRIAVISLATRPDCLGDEVLTLIRSLQEYKPVWVELGLQTIHPVTADLINRGYDLAVFTEAVRTLRNMGTDVIVHLILGLPGETTDDMLSSVRYLNQLDIQGVKLQLLHVLKNTELGKMYQNGMLQNAAGDDRFPFSREEYADLICNCIAELRGNIVIHRITGDAPRRDLIAPLWSMDKKKVLNTIHRYLAERNIYQGMCTDMPFREGNESAF